MASIQSLPCELLLSIMDYIGTDVISLVNAYPTALVCFTQKREFYIPQSVSTLLTRFDGSVGEIRASGKQKRILPMLLAAARLRHHLQKRASDPWTGMARAELREISHRYMLKVHHEPEPLHSLSLSALCALQAVGEDVDWVVQTYPEQALAEMSPSTKEKFDIVEIPGNLTDHHQNLFAMAALKFEVYCLTFFHGEKILFEKDLEFREKLLLPFTESVEEYESAIVSFHCMIYYVMHKHYRMLSSVAKQLGPEVSQSFIEPPMREQIARFTQRNDAETFTYVHYLMSQGLGMLAKLERMDMKELTTFTLSTFHHISATHHLDVPTTLRTPGFPLGPSPSGHWSRWTTCDIREAWRTLEILLEQPEVWGEIWKGALPFHNDSWSYFSNFAQLRSNGSETDTNHTRLSLAEIFGDSTASRYVEDVW